MAKSLESLLKGIGEYEATGDVNIQIESVSADSRQVIPNGLFVAIKGISSDGHDFISEAVKKRAAAVIGMNDIDEDILGGAVYIKVKDPRKALSIIAANWYGSPANKLRIIGVTGTDGKTTTSSIIYWILTSAGRKAGLISTVSAKIGEKEYDTGFHVTNPEPLALQEFLSKMVEANCEYAVLEVTSHGLDQDRVYGIDFDISVLTNITHEHIDYHKTFEDYAKAKAKLLNSSKLAIINSESRESVEKFIDSSVKKIYFDEETLKDGILSSAKSRFKENYNILNSAAATLAAKEVGISDIEIAKAIKSFPGVEGRMQEIKNDRGIRIIVDFAHTPNALENVLKALDKEKPKGSKLISVFGCAGERDVRKRQMMGEISARSADISVFTAEDPRSEDVNDIISEMVKGSDKIKGAEIHIIPERGEAIYYAINKLAKKGDTVAICGKGHEKSMGYGGTEYPWSDKEAAQMALAGKTKSINRSGKNEKSGIAVFGLGIEGCDLVRFLLKQGIKPTILEENPDAKIDDEFKDLEVVKGKEVSKSLIRFNRIYRSPGVYRYREDLLTAEKSGVEITSGIRQFFESCPGRIIGVTGTKGKGTTSTLIYEILKKAGKDAYLAGNIGKPYLEILPNLKKESIVVLELSSFQLIDIDRSPYVAVVLNITSDHLNWHKDINEYRTAKENIIRHQKEDDFAIINADYQIPKKFSGMTKAKVLYFSKTEAVKGCYVEDNRKIILSADEKVVVGEVDKLLLMGRHNWENVTAAICTAYVLGADVRSIKEVVFSFKGLEHRLELSGEVDGVKFYNDSFSTNPEPTIAAVRAFNIPLTLILGGYDKGLDYTEMGEEIADSRYVKNVILIGDTGLKIKTSLTVSGYKGNIIEMGKSGMKEIVAKSRSVTLDGGAVILSPASASFDMFKDYKERGRLFKEAVASLNND